MRRIRVLTITAGASLALCYLGLLVDSRGVFALGLTAFLTALSAWSGFVLGHLQHSYAQRRGWVLLGAALVGAALVGAGALGSIAVGGPNPFQSNEEFVGIGGAAPSAMPWVLGGLAILLVATFFVLAELLALVTRNARSLRARMVVLALATAAGVHLFSVSFEGGPLVQAATIALGAMLVFGMSLVLSYRFTEKLGEVVRALRRVSRGELQVRVEPRGRDELAELCVTFNAMTAGLEERQLLERAFGQYVAAPVLEKIRAAEQLTAAPDLLTATVLYSDIRGFTALSESCAPGEVLDILNRYFERIVEVVSDHQGYLNKFIGDSVMVVFNAPLPQPDHAARAVRCARAMQEALRMLNEVGAFGPARVLEVGIGVNTGPLVAGTLGSARRAEYTVIGDTVNVAARLTSAAGPGEILVGGDTAEAARAGGLDVVELPAITVKGKSAPLPVFRATG